MLSHLVAVLLLAQHAEPTPEQKQVNALVSQIRRLAASEPVVYGIDTRLQIAAVLAQAGKYPQIAKDQLRDAQAALGGVTGNDEQDRLRVRIVDLMAPLDFNEAERLIGSIRRERDEDFVAQAYERLIQCLLSKGRDTSEMISKGLAAGGFRSESAAKNLESLKNEYPSKAVALFAEILSAFPSRTPNEKDIYYLLDRTKDVAGVNRQIAVEAIDKALSAAISQKLQIKPAVRQKMLRQIGAQLSSIDPDLLDKYESEHEELRRAMATQDSAQPDELRKPDANTPSLSDLSYVDALSAARKIEDLGERTGALIEIYRREDISTQQRASVASEALSAATAMPITNDRLTVLAMISRDFARINQPASAAFAAQLLSETFTKACDCESASCERSGEKFDCLDLIGLFAAYLDEFKITPESMNLNNISLEARLLILKLYPALGIKRPSAFFQVTN